MTFLRATALVALIVAAALVLTACPSAAPPAPTTAPPTAAPALAPTLAPTATRPPATPTPRPATPTTAPALATPVPASPTAAGISAADLAAKARTTTEYSYDFKMTTSGQTITGKAYAKGTKMRQELSAAGMNTVMLIDIASKVAYMLLPDQKMATKVDFSQVADQAEPPGERVSALPSDARFVGTETVDGKPAAVYEVPSIKAKYWIWTERGLPLKVEIDTGTGKVVMEFTNFQFGSQPDSLFELPPGTQVTDIPVPGKVPLPLPTP